MSATVPGGGRRAAEDHGRSGGVAAVLGATGVVFALLLVLDLGLFGASLTWSGTSASCC